MLGSDAGSVPPGKEKFPTAECSGDHTIGSLSIPRDARNRRLYSSRGFTALCGEPPRDLVQRVTSGRLRDIGAGSSGQCANPLVQNDSEGLRRRSTRPGRADLCTDALPPIRWKPSWVIYAPTALVVDGHRGRGQILRQLNQGVPNTLRAHRCERSPQPLKQTVAHASAQGHHAYTYAIRRSG